jgi:hypothetical protein
LNDWTKDSETERRSSTSPTTQKGSTSTDGSGAFSLEQEQTTHEYKSLGRGQLVPALSIRVRGLDGVLQPETPALIDSGADVSTFPASWAKSLGIELSPRCCERKEATTAAGPATVWAYSQGLRVIIEGVEHWLKAEFCEGLDLPLLGRRDFFDAYKITFDERAKTFTLVPYGPGNWSQRGP